MLQKNYYVEYHDKSLDIKVNFMITFMIMITTRMVMIMTEGHCVDGVVDDFHVLVLVYTVYA